MDPHQTTIQDEKATPFFSDSKDDTYPQKKRVKHGSDIGSSGQHRVFDLDLDLPKRKPRIRDQWNEMFHFQVYKSVSPEEFEKMLTRCRAEITALEKARDKAKYFYIREFSNLEKIQDFSMVCRTIHKRQKDVNDDICKAREMFPDVEVDVKAYLTYREGVLLESQQEGEIYVKSIDRLLALTEFDKVIRYLDWVDRHLEQMEEFGISRMDVSCLILSLREKTQTNFDKEAYKKKKGIENFGWNDVSRILTDNKVSIVEHQSVREVYEKVETGAKEWALTHEYKIRFRMHDFVDCLEDASRGLGILRQQFELLYEKNVIDNGHYGMTFNRDWRMACEPEFVDDEDE